MTMKTPFNVLRHNDWSSVPRATVVGSAILGSLGIGTTTLFSIGGIAITNAMVVGYLVTTAITSWASRALAPSFSVPKPNSSGTMVNSIDPAHPVEFVYGRVRKGGVATYYEGASNGSISDGFLYQIIVIAGHEIEEVESIYLNDEIVTIDSNGFVTSSNWSNRVRIYIADGSQNAASDSFSNVSATLANSLHSETSVSSSFIGKGLSYLYVRYEHDEDVFSNGLPKVTAIIKGKKVFDPRTSTTGHSSNAALVIRDFISSSYGLDDDNIDDISFQAAANECDESVTTADGSESRYEINGIVRADQSAGDVLQMMSLSCAGTLFYGGGNWKLKAGAYSAPVKSLDMDDLRSAISIDAKINMRDNFNTVRGTFNDQDQNWITADYSEIVGSTFVTEDNNETVATSLDFPFTTSHSMAQRIAKMTLYRSREQITFTADFSTKAIDVEVGDNIQFTSDRYSWSDKVFEVIGWSLNPGESGELLVSLTLRETSSSAFNWNSSEEGAITANNTNLPNINTVAAVTGLKAYNNGRLDSDGTFQPRAVIDFDDTSQAFHSFYEMRHRDNYLSGLSLAQHIDFAGGPTTTSGATVFADKSGNGLTAYNDTTYTGYTVQGGGPTGTFLQKTSIDGDGLALLSQAQIDALDTTNGFGHTFWVRIDDYSAIVGDARLFSRDASDYGALYFNSGTSWNNTWTSGNVSLTEDEWYFVYAARAGNVNTLKIYAQDGTLVKNNTATRTYSTDRGIAFFGNSESSLQTVNADGQYGSLESDHELLASIADIRCHNGGILSDAQVLKLLSGVEGYKYTTQRLVDSQGEILGNKAGDQISYGVRSVTTLGRRSQWVSNTITLNGDDFAPGLPTSITATAGIAQITLSWTNPSDDDLAHVRIFRATTNSFGSAVQIAVIDADTYIDSPLDLDTAYYYWFKSEDFSGNLSDETSSVTATTLYVSETDLDPAYTNSVDTAAQSAAAAAASASNAALAETAAELAETNAETAETAAQAARAAAETAETNAASSATSASASATSASTSAGTATTKASEASVSATNALASSSSAATQATTAAEARKRVQLVDGGVRNAGFEIGSNGLIGVPAGWIGDSEQSSAFTLRLGYRSDVDSNSEYASELSFGTLATDAGDWWSLEKYFLAEPSQTFAVSARVRMLTLNAGSNRTSTNFVDEDDWMMVARWYDDDGALLSSSATITFSVRYRTDNGGSEPSSNTWLLWESENLTAPANTAYVKLELAAVDIAGTAADRTAYKTASDFLGGNAACLIDDVVFSSTNGDILEIEAASVDTASNAAAAATSSTSAAASETAAATSASSASSSANTASTQANNASTSASAASTSASSAAASSTAASSSATSAASSASTATTKAGEASVSASSAAVSETNAGNFAVESTRTKTFLSKQNQAAGMLAPQICLNAATYRLASYEDNTVIYKNGVELVTLDRGEISDQGLSVGDRLTSSKPFYGLNNSSDPYTNALASEAMADTRWFMMVDRYDNQTVRIYPLADGNANYTFSTTHIDDEDVTDGSVTTTAVALTGGTVTTLTLPYSGSTDTYFNLSSDVPVMVFKKGTSGDGALLMPTDIEIYSREAGTPRFTTTTTDSQGVNVTYTALGGGAYSSDDGIRKMAAFATADGSGGDAEGHIGRSAIGDEYVISCVRIDNYWLTAPEDCTVVVRDKFAAVRATHSLTAYTSVQVGTSSGSGTSLYGNDGPFYFSGTKPFALQAQVDARDDEEMHYGFRRDLKPRYGLEAISEINQSSIADINGNLSSAVTLRAKAGTGGAELELVAADNVDGGSVSTARIDADNIILDGTVTAGKIQADEILSSVSLRTGGITLNTDGSQPKPTGNTAGFYAIGSDNAVTGATSGDVVFGSRDQYVSWDESTARLEITGTILDLSERGTKDLISGSWVKVPEGSFDILESNPPGLYHVVVIGPGGGGGAAMRINSNASLQRDTGQGTYMAATGGGGGAFISFLYSWNGNNDSLSFSSSNTSFGSVNSSNDTTWGSNNNASNTESFASTITNGLRVGAGIKMGPGGVGQATVSRNDTIYGGHGGQHGIPSYQSANQIHFEEGYQLVNFNEGTSTMNDTLYGGNVTLSPNINIDSAYLNDNNFQQSGAYGNAAGYNKVWMNTNSSFVQVTNSNHASFIDFWENCYVLDARNGMAAANISAGAGPSSTGGGGVALFARRKEEDLGQSADLLPPNSASHTNVLNSFGAAGAGAGPYGYPTFQNYENSTGGNYYFGDTQSNVGGGNANMFTGGNYVVVTGASGNNTNSVGALPETGPLGAPNSWGIQQRFIQGTGRNTANTAINDNNHIYQCTVGLPGIAFVGGSGVVGSTRDDSNSTFLNEPWGHAWAEAGEGGLGAGGGGLTIRRTNNSTTERHMVVDLGTGNNTDGALLYSDSTDLLDGPVCESGDVITTGFRNETTGPGSQYQIMTDLFTYENQYALRNTAGSAGVAGAGGFGGGGGGAVMTVTSGINNTNDNTVDAGPGGQGAMFIRRIG